MSERELPIPTAQLPLPSPHVASSFGRSANPRNKQTASQSQLTDQTVHSFTCRATSCFSHSCPPSPPSLPSLPRLHFVMRETCRQSESRLHRNERSLVLCLVLHKFSAAVLWPEIRGLRSSLCVTSHDHISHSSPSFSSASSSLLSLIQVSELFTHSPSLLVIISLCRHFHDCFSRRRCRRHPPYHRRHPLLSSNTSLFCRTITSKNNCRSAQNSLLVCCFTPIPS